MDCNKLDNVLRKYNDAYNEMLAVVSEWLGEWLGGADEKPLSAPVCFTTVYGDIVVVRGVKRADYAITFVYEREGGEEDYILLEEVTAWSLTYLLTEPKLREKYFV